MTAGSLSNRAPYLAMVMLCGVCLLGWTSLAPHISAAALAAYDPQAMLAFYSGFPRLVVALMCGAALALSGSILQIALRNPLAAPTTLGLASGAHFALVVAGLFIPGLLGLARDGVALTGSLLAAGLVFLLAGRRQFHPSAMILAGLVTGLYFGAAATVLTLLNDRYLLSLFVWGSGSLSQQDWSVASSLGWKLAVFAVLALALGRPLALLALGDSSARSLGLSPMTLRLLAVAVSVGLAAIVTSSVGVIGFIGLAAPLIARMSGARRPGMQLLWSPFIGAGLLALVDQLMLRFAGSMSVFVPTGALTALLGSPLLLLLLLFQRQGQVDAGASLVFQRYRGSVLPVWICAVGLPLAAIVLAIFLGRTPGGEFQWMSLSALQDIWVWRGPRVFSAAVAGGMLAVAGVILQRLSRNDMASPEVLGVGAGAMLGLFVAVMIDMQASAMTLSASATVGALGILALLALAARKTGYRADRLVLGGIALAALLDAMIGALAATGDPRSLLLLRWMSGSTYGATWGSAFWSFGVGLVLFAMVLALHRWLDILGLGEVGAKSLGVPVPVARGLFFLAAGSLTAVSTLAVGPLSFVGLMAPHVIRQLGFTKSLSQSALSFAAGAVFMVLADWIGRTWNHPYDMPSGLICALIGAPVFLAIFLRRSRA